MTLKLLFVCTENRLRSATAESVFSEYDGVEAIGAGTNADAPTPVSGDLIEWADVILFMESIHKKRVTAKFQTLVKGRKLVTLDIPDRYSFMQGELIELLRRKVARSVSIKTFR